MDNSNPPFTKWFPGGELSVCYNAVDRHVDEGFGEQPALIWDSPITNSKDTVTYAQLQDKVARLAGVLAREGVGRGDRVLIYMPMVTEAVIAMLATVRLGAAHSVVFGGFAAKELAVRIRHAEPKVIIPSILIISATLIIITLIIIKVIISASCGIEPNRIVQYKPSVDEAIRLAGADNVKSLVLQVWFDDYDCDKYEDHDCGDNCEKYGLMTLC